MKRQRGQSAVEFALVAPFIILMVLGMIYGGIMFMDYFNYNNQARRIAREVSLARPSERAELKDNYEGRNAQAGIYNVKFEIDYNEKQEDTDNEDEDNDVEVRVNFSRGSSKVLFFFMPENFTIKYRMRLENTVNISDNST